MKRDTIPTPPIAPPPALALDEIRVKGKVVKVRDSSSNEVYWFKLKVLQLISMGSSAPVVTPGDTLKVKAGQSIEWPKKDSLYEMNLMHRQVMAQFKDSAASWIYIKSQKVKMDKTEYEK